MGMAERIEWEEIEALVEKPVTVGMVRRAEIRAALEAGEGLHEALAKHQRVGPRHEQECDWCRAMAEWRRCVAPRGEGG